jgi:hypothetical protein
MIPEGHPKNACTHAHYLNSLQPGQPNPVIPNSFLQSAPRPFPSTKLASGHLRQITVYNLGFNHRWVLFYGRGT